MYYTTTTVPINELPNVPVKYDTGQPTSPFFFDRKFASSRQGDTGSTHTCPAILQYQLPPYSQTTQYLDTGAHKQVHMVLILQVPVGTVTVIKSQT